MSIPKFDPKELEVKMELPGYGGGPNIKILNYPLNQHDHCKNTFMRKPWWQMYQATDAQIFTPRIIPDNIARAFCIEGQPFDAVKDGGGVDMFGIEWEYIEQVGGSMVRPGEPLLEDISEWREKVVWPDVDSWDWEGSAKLNNGTYLRPENFNQMWFHTGWYERLISMMDFEGAIMAIFDEDSQDEVHAFFDKLTETYLKIFENVCKYYPDVHAFFIHDDWGSQKAPFFSPAVAEEMLVPYMKRVTDYLHSQGKFCEFHSCGNIIQQVPNMIAAGWDAWAPQLMNDCEDIYNKYGDQILIATYPQDMPENYEELSEEEHRRYAREYAEKYCNPDKPTFYNFYAAHFVTPAFREELYIQSRKKYSGE